MFDLAKQKMQHNTCFPLNIKNSNPPVWAETQESIYGIKYSLVILHESVLLFIIKILPKLVTSDWSET